MFIKKLQRLIGVQPICVREEIVDLVREEDGF